MDRLFQIGDFCFRIISELPYAAPDHFLQFSVEAGRSEYTYRIWEVPSLPVPGGKKIVRRADLEVMQKEEKETRLIGIKGKEGYYACYQEVSSDEAEIWVTNQVRGFMPSDTVYGSLFSLERQMIKHDSLILHCSYITCQGKAVLFSAPSGTGKSTQADLWEKYRGSRTVNGDRALLRKINGQWYACGWPVCGSSGICEARDTPVHAIVMLRQGKSDYAERLSPVRAFSQLYAQITINQWNRDFVERAFCCIEDLISKIPVWQLTCDISEEAVDCLETVLFPENNTGEGGRKHEI